MLAFSGKWVKAITSGKKTVTFRKWPTARVKVGGTYDAATIGYPPKKFAKVEITGLRALTESKVPCFIYGGRVLFCKDILSC